MEPVSAAAVKYSVFASARRANHRTGPTIATPAIRAIIHVDFRRIRAPMKCFDGAGTSLCARAAKNACNKQGQTRECIPFCEGYLLNQFSQKMVTTAWNKTRPPRLLFRGLLP